MPGLMQHMTGQASQRMRAVAGGFRFAHRLPHLGARIAARTWSGVAGGRRITDAGGVTQRVEDRWRRRDQGLLADALGAEGPDLGRFFNQNGSIGGMSPMVGMR